MNPHFSQKIFLTHLCDSFWGTRLFRHHIPQFKVIFSEWWNGRTGSPGCQISPVYFLDGKVTDRALQRSERPVKPWMQDVSISCADMRDGRTVSELKWWSKDQMKGNLFLKERFSSVLPSEIWRISGEKHWTSTLRRDFRFIFPSMSHTFVSVFLIKNSNTNTKIQGEKPTVEWHPDNIRSLSLNFHLHW